MTRILFVPKICLCSHFATPASLPPVYRDQLDYTIYEDGRAIGRSRSGIRGRTMRNDNDRRIVLDTPVERRLPMPSSLQYPLELDRRLLRRWDRLRTATAIKGAAIDSLNAIPLAAATIPVTRALVGTMPPRNRWFPIFDRFLVIILIFIVDIIR
jgi:hypothetical protein